MTSGGGVTISGGEGMIQPDFAEALAAKLKAKGIHTAIETTGCVGPEIFQRLAPQFDLLLYDVKHYDPSKHRKGTGLSNEQMGERKYEFLNRKYELTGVKALHPEDLTAYQEVFLDRGIDCFF